jgi:hypothetical protein
MVFSRTKAGSRHASIRLAGMIRASAVGLDERPTARARVDELATIFEFLDRRMPDLLLELECRWECVRKHMGLVVVRQRQGFRPVTGAPPGT